MKEFDPDKPHLKKRSMTGVHYEQDGYKFTAGHVYIGKILEDNKVETQEDVSQKKQDVRTRAAEKLAAKKKLKGSLEGFREKENPDAVDSMLRENAASKKAEELAE